MNKSFFILIAFSILFCQNTYTQPKSLHKVKKIKIGLLIGNNKFDEARKAAQLAIDEANTKSGNDDLQFELVARSLEGPWGTGSKEAVNLIFNDKVWAILGSHDSQNAHLVEQVISKTQIVFLSAWASDPTLTQAFIPWYFSCIPNDMQQANVLIDEIYNKRRESKIAIVSDRSYDSELATKSLLKEVKIAGKEMPLQLFYDNSSNDFTLILNKIKQYKANGIILFGPSSQAYRIIQEIWQKNMNLHLFGSISLLGENYFDNRNLEQDKNVSFLTTGTWLKNKELSFRNKFIVKFGKTPGAISAYAYDGMNILIEAIRQSGYELKKMQKSMSNTYYKGITGPIQFDKKGNRTGNIELVDLYNVIPSAVEK